MRKAIYIPWLLIFFLASSTMALPVDQVDDWTYQLQGFTNGLNQLQQSRFDLVVIDYSQTGEAASQWTPAEIENLKSSGPCGDRIVLAYISIGEAEDYRFYWDDDWVDASGDPVPGVAPDWLGPQNPEWPGNYKVRYWLPGWQNILYGSSSGPEISYLDQILHQGFDGIYMDIIDAFEYWGPSEIGGNNENRDAAREMIDLVSNLADYSRNTTQHSGFLIFPQNGSYIIDPDCYPDSSNPQTEAAQQAARYFNIIDGIGAEDTFFTGDADENNPYNPDNWTINLLNQFRDAGNCVLSVEYITQPDLITAFYTTYAPAQNYVPCATVRDLGSMTINPGFEPDCESSVEPEIYIELFMGQSSFSTGDNCKLDLNMTNNNQARPVDLYILLETYGVFFAYPLWNNISSGLSPTRHTVISGVTTLEVIPMFIMPPVTNAGPFTFYAIMFEPEKLDLNHAVSNIEITEFSLL